MATEKDWLPRSTFLGTNPSSTDTQTVVAPQGDIIERDLGKPLTIRASLFGRTAGVAFGLQSAMSLSGPWTTFVDDFVSDGPAYSGTGTTTLLVDPRLNPTITTPGRYLRWFLQADTSTEDWHICAQLRVDDPCECAPGVITSPAGAYPVTAARLGANPTLLRERLLRLGSSAEQAATRIGPSYDLVGWTSLFGSTDIDTLPVTFPLSAPFDTADLCSMLVSVETLYSINASVVLETAHSLEGTGLGEWEELQSPPPDAMHGVYYLSKRPCLPMTVATPPTTQVQVLRRYLRCRVKRAAAGAWAICWRVQMTVCA